MFDAAAMGLPWICDVFADELERFALDNGREPLGPPQGMEYDGGVYIEMKRLVLIPAVLAVMVLAAFPVVFASHSTPFNGSFSGTFTLDSSQTKATITGSGHREHMGATSFAAMSTITGSASCEHGFTATEQETFTAANGDKVFTSSNDVLCPTSANNFQITGSWTITGAPDALRMPQERGLSTHLAL